MIRCACSSSSADCLRIHVAKPGRSCSLSQIDIARYSCDARNSSLRCSLRPFSRSLVMCPVLWSDRELLRHRRREDLAALARRHRPGVHFRF